MVKQRADLTYKHNLKQGRHGWVRLTPAYSVKIVSQILDDHPEYHTILEPFSGTGTTGLVAAQRGLSCDLLDINPFLIWLARVKCANYSSQHLSETIRYAEQIVMHVQEGAYATDGLWTPPISHIDRWWSASRLRVLAALFHALNQALPEPCAVRDLLLVAFCRAVIKWSNAAFNHQSMSFKDQAGQQQLFAEDDEILRMYQNDVAQICDAAALQISGHVNVRECDARDLSALQPAHYDAVITSPPYVNRMSYIRELRPYMFWLGHLETARDAGELDWTAIGGTWGIATSRLNTWAPNSNTMALSRLAPLLSEIAESSDVLSRYVQRYFADMDAHFRALASTIKPDGRIFYIVGNSKFYDTLVPAEQLYSDLIHRYGFVDITIETIRKRNSKKELYEYLVSARKPR